MSICNITCDQKCKKTRNLKSVTLINLQSSNIIAAGLRCARYHKRFRFDKGLLKLGFYQPVNICTI